VRAVARSWISPQVKTAKALLYVGAAVAGTIDIFTVNGSQYVLSGQIVDENAPAGIKTDAAGNLYVADLGVKSEGPAPGDIAVYPKGSTNPIRTILPTYWDPYDVAFDDTSSLYVANIAPVDGFSPGSVSVFGPHNKILRVLRSADFDQVLGVIANPKTADLYVTYNSTLGPGRVALFRNAQGSPITLPATFGSVWGITNDGDGNLLVADGTGPLDIVSVKTGQIVSSIAVPGAPLRPAFNTDRSLLYVSNFNNFDVEIFSYPSGKLIGSINRPEWQKNAWPEGVAFWPPAPWPTR
jgi:hypothetical protein